MIRRASRRQFLKSSALAGAGLWLGNQATAARCQQPAPAKTPSASGQKIFRAGAYAIDVTPPKLPVIVNGYTVERSASRVYDPLHARCLVLDDGTECVAIAVVDICVMPRDLLDKAKQLAHEATGIPVDRMLISATHTHSAPSAMPALGSRADPDYVEFLPGQIAKGIKRAVENIAPARIGWAAADGSRHTHSRRWIMRSDRVGLDRFGQQKELARMCPGYQNPDAVGPSGPVDGELSVMAVQSPDGRPVALLANYSMHYFHATPLSAGYYGRFVGQIEKLIGVDDAEPRFVGIMSQGTSGDQMYMDYSKPKPGLDIDTYSQAVAEVAYEAYKQIRYHDWVPLAMREMKLTLRRRVPDEKRLAWAKRILPEMHDGPMRDRNKIFAREQIYLSRNPSAELKLQALRIGDLGVTAIPCEVYGITGLKLKAQSPLEATFNIALANGEEGYIPPPEQHKLGGYSAWEARTAGLEETAEPKIVEAVLGLLEQVAGKPQRKPTDTHGPYAEAVLASKPVAYWRMTELCGPTAADATGNKNHAVYEDRVAFYLEGPPSLGFSGGKVVNRCAHFAGGRMKASVRNLGDTYSVEMWISSGMPADARPVAGYFFSRDPDGGKDAPGDHLGIGGTAGSGGRLFFSGGNRFDEMLRGTTEIALKTWHHVVLVRQGEKVAVYLDGDTEPEVVGTVKIANASNVVQLFVGGRNDNWANFEGKIDEVAVFDRTLTPEEITRHYQAAAGGVHDQ